MNLFPSLDKWFEVQVGISEEKHKYTRYDLCIKKDLTLQDIEIFINELALVIARLRLGTSEYKKWNEYWNNQIPIPQPWKQRFREAFWYSFVSEINDENKTVNFDEFGLQGYIGELILYLIQIQRYDQRIDASPRKPKAHSKDSGIDCLEICGNKNDYGSLHYIVWESKATTSNDPGSYPSKIYNQHLNDAGKSFRNMVDFFEDVYAEDENLNKFVGEIINDFYATVPTLKKRFGGCVTLSTAQPVSPDAFSAFFSKFQGRVANDNQCRQVRFCSIGEISKITEGVRKRIWNKLLP